MSEPTTCEWCGTVIQPGRRRHLASTECLAAMKQALAHSEAEVRRLRDECSACADRRSELASLLTTAEIDIERLQGELRLETQHAVHANDEAARLQSIADRLRHDWADDEAELIEKDVEIKRLQGALSLTKQRGRVLEGACLMANEELTFGGDWIAAKAVIARALAHPGGGGGVMELLRLLAVIKSLPCWPAGICARWLGYRAPPDQMAMLKTVSRVYPNPWRMRLSDQSWN